MRKLTISRSAYLYTFYSTVSMSLILIVPLYLVSIGISISVIVFILALTPVSFAFLRLFLAGIVADFLGFGALFLLIIATHLAYVFINGALLTEKVSVQKT